MTYQDIIEEDGTVTRWRDGVAVVYANEQEARMSERLSAAREFQAAHDIAKAQAKALLSACDEVRKIRMANAGTLTVPAERAVSSPEEVVGDSSMTNSEVYTACLLYDIIESFRSQMIGSMTVEQALYRR